MTDTDKFLDFLFEDGRSVGVPAAEVEAFLARVERYLKGSDTNERGGDGIRLWMALAECRALMRSDGEAEAIRRGVRLGLCLAAYDRKVYALAVTRSRQSEGVATKRQASGLRYATIVSRYYELRETMDCLSARKQLEKELKQNKNKIGFARIGQILREQGITLNCSYESILRKSTA